MIEWATIRNIIESETGSTYGAANIADRVMAHINEHKCATQDVSSIVFGVKMLGEALPAHKITQIKIVRAFTGFGLRESKDIIEAVNAPPVCPVTAAVQAALKSAR